MKTTPSVLALLSIRGFFVLLIAGALPILLAPLVRSAEPPPFAGWKQSGTVWVLTTPEGADLPASAVLENFPLLVRLHRDWFDFSQAKPDGADLRISSSTGEPLPFQIEEWDAPLGRASIWVRVPKILGNARQSIKLYWGNPDAKSASNGAEVFGAANGYVSVWHMNELVRDEVGTLPSDDTGTLAAAGVIGAARRFPGQKGIFGGDKIANYPSGASSHSTEAWFRCEQPNVTLIGWGNEGGGRGSKVRMQLRSPPHIRIDSDFSDVKGEQRLALGEWLHVVHTYDREDGRIYINGRLDAAAKPLLDIKTPSRLWLGGWYHNYDFVGDLDEVRISRVARSPDWIRLQYENQKPNQTVVGPLVQSGDAFAVSPPRLTVAEGKSAMLAAQAGGAQKIYWLLRQGERESVVATDRFSLTFDAGRVDGDQSLTLVCRAVYPTAVRSQEIAVVVRETIPEPEFTLTAPADWDGRREIEIVPQIKNLDPLQAAGAARLSTTWSIDGVAVLRQEVGEKLLLKRSQGSGVLRIQAAMNNGGAAQVRKVAITVREPSRKEPWAQRPLLAAEQPEDNQFFAREGDGDGTLVYAGKLAAAAEAVFVRLFADDRLVATEKGAVAADRTYSLSVKLKPGLIKYRTEFGSQAGGIERVLHSAANLVCGDVYLIDGQSNAVATDIGQEDPSFTSDWIRSFGGMAGDPNNARLKRWGNAVARDRKGGQLQIGYWGMELGQRLVESQKLPICILNGAVGGSRIDQHQRNSADPPDVTTIYGRLLWRVQQARLTHGVRGILWHQGENDQGADGPTGGFGWETYQRYFVEMSAGWKEDFPNVQQYYLFQIWPKACSMGINGSDNQLREVQRTLPKMFSNLSVMSTLGVKPPGGCHFPKEGYAEFARLIAPVIEQQQYGRSFVQPVTPPNLMRASFTTALRDEIRLEFDQPVVWNDKLLSQFYLGGEAKWVTAGAVSNSQLTLKLKSSTPAGRVTYLDSANWSTENLLYGKNGIAALTFCDVPIEPAR